MRSKFIKIFCTGLAAINIATAIPAPVIASVPDIPVSMSVSATRLHNTWVNKGLYKYYYVFNKPVKGFKTIEGKTYYFSENTGAMQKGWKTIDDKKYYFNSDGTMVTGNVKINGIAYSFASDGAMQGKQKFTVTFKDGVTGKVIKKQTVEYGGSAKVPTKPVHSGYRFVRWSGSYLLVKENKTITAVYAKTAATSKTKSIKTKSKAKTTGSTKKKGKTGWKRKDGKMYYYQNGKLVTGTKTINGEYCKFSSKGVLQERILKITYINQNAGVWNGKKYTSSGFVQKGTVAGYNIGRCGCGITSSAMAISGIKGKVITPDKFLSSKYGFNGRGSNGDVAKLCGKKYKLKGGAYANVKKSDLIKKLLQGHYFVVYVCRSPFGGAGDMQGGDRCTGGHHFVLIHGYKDGKFAIADPNNTAQTYVRSGVLKSYESFNSHRGSSKGYSYSAVWK